MSDNGSGFKKLVYTVASFIVCVLIVFLALSWVCGCTRAQASEAPLSNHVLYTVNMPPPVTNECPTNMPPWGPPTTWTNGPIPIGRW